jgi:excisionase family DNA binding protein
MSSPAKFLYRREEAADALGYSVSTVDMLIATGQLRATRTGRRVLVPAAEIERYAKRPPRRLWPPKVDGKTWSRFARAGETIKTPAEATL